MLGFGLSLGVAILKAVSDVTQKRATTVIAHDEIVILLQRCIEVLVAILVLAAGVYLAFISPSISASLYTYFAVVILAAGVNFAAFYCNVRALRLSDVSLVSPISQLTPAVLLVTSPFMLGESVSAGGVAGVLLVVLGAYVLGIKHARVSVRSLYEPLLHLASDRGVRYALLASVLYGFSANLDKIGVKMSDPFVFTIASGVAMASGIALYSFVAHRNRLIITGSQVNSGLYPGLSGGVGSLLQMIAISLWPVAYVIAVKRLSAVFSVLTGAYLFKEKDLLPRLLGAAVMVAGTAVILIYG